MSSSDRKEGLEAGLREHERQRMSLAPVPFPADFRYEIRAPLGEGVSARVFRAWDRELKRPVALKVLRDAFARAGDARERFRREAEAVARLAHPHVVAIHDAGERDGTPYLVMELVEGRALSEILREKALPPAERVGLLEKVARGVAAAHARGIVHRDLKPGNVLVPASGEPKVADFGLAHLAEASTALTGTGAVVGTPLYMAPEQVRGAAVVPATDVYALGAILYEMLAGRPPHTGTSAIEIYAKVLRDEPAPLRDVPPALRTIVLRALEKDPGARYADAGGFAEDLRRFRAGEPVPGRPSLTVRRIGRKIRNHGVALACAAVAVAAGLGLAAWRRDRAELRDFLLRVPQIDEVRGEAWHQGVDGRSPAAVARKLLAGDILETGADAAAVLKYPDQATVELGAASRVRLPEREARALRLERGTLLLKTDAPLVVVSPRGRVEASRGVATVALDGDVLRVDVLAGEARAGDVQVGVGEHALLSAGGTEIRPTALGALGDFVKSGGVDESLVGHWRLDEGRGDEVVDTRGLRGKIRDGARWAVDAGRPVIQLDGKGARVELPSTPELDRLQERSYTLMAWFRPDSIPASRGGFHGAAILMKGGWREGLMYSDRGGMWMLHWNRPSSWMSIGGGHHPPGHWRHVAGVVDYETRRTEVFVDGEPASAVEWPGPGSAEEFTGSAWTLGRIAYEGTPTYFAHGALRDARLYARALRKPEVQAVYHAELRPPRR